MDEGEETKEGERMKETEFVGVSPLEVGDILEFDGRDQGADSLLLKVSDIVQVNSVANQNTEFLYKLETIQTIKWADQQAGKYADAPVIQPATP
jgi:hypothetical protein